MMQKILFILFSFMAIGVCVAAAVKKGDDDAVLEAVKQTVEPRMEVITGPEEDTECNDVGEGAELVSVVDPRLVNQLAVGMRRVKERRDHGLWYHCGQRLDEKQREAFSIVIASNVLINMKSIGGLDDVSPWGVLATAYHESGFDACSLGTNPRKWAYKNNLLKPPRAAISHTKQEVLEVIENPRAKRKYSKSGYDLGYFQILSRFYRGQENDMLSIENGVRIGIMEMKARADRHKTKMPWLYWRGHEAQWYRKKIRRFAKMMGAPKKEMRKI